MYLRLALRMGSPWTVSRDSEGFGVRQCRGAFRRRLDMTESGAEPPHSKALREEQAESFCRVHGPNAVRPLQAEIPCFPARLDIAAAVADCASDAQARKKRES